MAFAYFQCAASNDDARENSGTVGLTANSVRTVNANQWLGFRFPNVTIPSGATLVDVYLVLDVKSPYTTPGGCSLGLQDVDDALVFTTATNNLSNRSRVGTVTWSGTVSGGLNNTPSLLSQFEAVIARPGWVDGNAMAALIRGVSASDLDITAYDGNPSYAASLAVEYTPAASGQPTIARARLVPGMRRPHGSQGW